MQDRRCRILENRETAPGCFEMWLQPDAETDWLSSLQAGCFFELKINAGPDPLLRRPFSVFDVRDDAFSILYILHGRGTTMMAGMQAGESVALLGPLGNTFEWSKKTDRHLLIAGGIGIAPFLLLARSMLNDGVAPEAIHLIFGARDKTMLYEINRFKSLGIHCHTITDDGSSGRQGFVTDLLTEQLTGASDTVVGYCCGPTPMFRAVQTLMQDFPDFHCQFTLESMMACGVGVCNVCAVEHQDFPDRYVKVCSQGPVFDGRKLIFSPAFR